MSQQQHGSDFVWEARTLLCPACGAPLSVPADGGLVGCRFCGVTNEIRRRPERPVKNDAPRGARTGDASWPPDPVPPLEWSLESRRRLHGARPRAKLEVIRKSWLHAYSGVQSGTAKNEDLFHVLTMAMAVVAMQLNSGEGLEIARAALESAVDVTRVDVHRCVYFAQLALIAACANQLDAAKSYLAQAEPPEGVRSKQLHTVTVLARSHQPGDTRSGPPERLPGSNPSSRRELCFPGAGAGHVS